MTSAAWWEGKGQAFVRALVTALLGTPYLPDLTGAILFVEDVGEAPYRIDGMLARLRLAGVLERLGGLVFGLFTDADVPPDRPTFSVDEVLAQYAPYVGGPVASGLVVFIALAPPSFALAAAPPLPAAACGWQTTLCVWLGLGAR